MRLKCSSFAAGLIFLLSAIATSTDAAEPRDPNRWQEAIDAFLAADKEHPTEPGGIVFVGSSSIVMWDLAKSFPDRKLLNRGFGGSEIADSTHYFTELVAKHQPRLVFFYAGDNDVAAGNTADQVYADFLAFLRKFRAELPEAQLVYISIKPSIARWHLADEARKANALISADCEFDDQLTFLDVWPAMLGEDGKPRPDIFLEDGLHMNEKGYGLWNELARPLLK